MENADSSLTLWRQLDSEVWRTMGLLCGHSWVITAVGRHSHAGEISLWISTPLTVQKQWSWNQSRWSKSMVKLESCGGFADQLRLSHFSSTIQQSVLCQAKCKTEGKIENWIRPSLPQGVTASAPSAFLLSAVYFRPHLPEKPFLMTDFNLLAA